MVLKTLCKASYPSGLARLYQSAIILIQFVCYRSEDLPLALQESDCQSCHDDAHHGHQFDEDV